MTKFLDKAGLEHFWASLKSIFNSKVDKVSGKGLSTNDFTNESNNKLSTAYSKAHVHSNKALLDRVPSPKGKKWLHSQILTMIASEKYIGDLLLQKTYTKKGIRYKNRG